MRALFNHALLTSFYLFLNNSLGNGAQAYSNVTGQTLYPMNTQGSVVGNVWASPWKGWVYDSAVSGATIISGVMNSSGQFLTRASGIVIDYINGRVISPQNWGNGLSGSFARPDYNFYTSNESDTNFWLDRVFNANPNIAYAATGAPDAPFFAPCVILTNSNEHNDPFALGGLDQTRNTIRAYVISNNGWQQEGVDSWFRDLARTYFALGTYTDMPITASGDLKTGGFNYVVDICNKYGLTPGVYIEAVHGYRFSQRTNQTTAYSVAVTEFDCNTMRLPRQSQ